MTVQELIDELKMQDRDAEVKFAYCYGDHWRTMVARDIERVEPSGVEHSSYHQTDKLLDDEDSFDEESGEPKPGVRIAVVLS
jgi:hypothetical protein